MNERVQELEEAAKTRDRMILSLRKEMSDLKAAKMHAELMKKQREAELDAFAKAKLVEKQANETVQASKSSLHALLEHYQRTRQPPAFERVFAQGDSRLMKPSPVHTFTPAGDARIDSITVYASSGTASPECKVTLG